MKLAHKQKFIPTSFELRKIYLGSKTNIKLKKDKKPVKPTDVSPMYRRYFDTFTTVRSGGHAYKRTTV